MNRIALLMAFVSTVACSGLTSAATTGSQEADDLHDQISKLRSEAAVRHRESLTAFEATEYQKAIQLHKQYRSATVKARELL